MAKSLMCRLGRHTWELRQEPGNAPFYECARCGTTKNEYEKTRSPGSIGG